MTLEDLAHLYLVTLALLIPEMWVAPGAGREFQDGGDQITKEEPLTGTIGLPATSMRQGRGPEFTGVPGMAFEIGGGSPDPAPK